MQIDYIGVSIGIVGIFIGVVVSYFFYRKSLRIKEPCWAIRSNNLIQGYSDKFERLRVTFNGEEVENLTITKVLFWNNGTDTIDRHDIETVNKLRIECKNKVKILDVKILACNNPSNQFDVTISEDGNFAYIQFDYLDHKQGAVTQVIHTGTSSKDLMVAGDIKGANTLTWKTVSPKWAQWVNDKIRISRRTRKKTTAISGIIVGVIYIILGAIKLFLPTFFVSSPIQNPQKELSLVATLLFGGVVLLLMGLSSIKEISPKGLEAFSEE